MNLLLFAIVGIVLVVVIDEMFPGIGARQSQEPE
jgi:hypothetical protein